MRSMGDQFDAIMSPRIEGLGYEHTKPIADMISERMKSNTLQGNAFAGDEYESVYSLAHMKTRKYRGYQTGTVDLRMGERRIETATTDSVGKGAKIYFQSGGEIFKMHHEGTAKGGKTRSIFPKTPNAIPSDIALKAAEIIRGVLRGGQ